MSYSLTITPKGALFRTKPGLETLEKHFGAAYRIGGYNGAFMFSPAPPPADAAGDTAYMVVGAGPQLGRGFFLICNKNGSCEVSTPLPTTSHDLEDLFTFADQLAKLLEVRELQDESGRSIPRAALTALFGEVRQQNMDVLQSYVATAKLPMVSAVRMPLYLPESLCRRISGVPAVNGEVYFSTYLAEKQAPAYTYLMPAFSVDEGGTTTGSYTLVEDEPYVLPKTPFIPTPQPPFGGAPVQRWVALLQLRGSALPPATLPYEKLAEGLVELEIAKGFDERHWIIRGLSQKKMNDLLG